MKRYGNLYSKICDADNISLAIDKAAKGKRWQQKVQTVLANKDKYIKYVQDKLIYHEFHTHKYKHKIIFEPKERQIFILPFFPDRIVHHAIMNVLESIWESLFISDSYACRKNKGQMRGSNKCLEFVRKNQYVLQCDISKFYPSLDHDILKRIIRRKIKDKEVLWILDDIIDSVDGVPIGNYLSQWFGNLYLNELDHIIKQDLHIKCYFRYCDDFFLFGTKRKLQEIKPIVVNYVKNVLKLKLSKCELFPTSHGVDALGYRHFPSGKVLVRKSTAKRMKQRLKELAYRIKHKTISKQLAEGQIASAYGWLAHANAHNLYYKLNVNNLWRLVDDYG